MKNILWSIAAIALMISFTACTEVNPLGNTDPTDTTQTTQQQNILIEDITGVRCPNCPEAHEIAKQLQDDNPGRVEVVAIHNGALSSPFPYSLYNFKIPQGTQIDNFLGPAGYWPLGALNRLYNETESSYFFDRVLWSGFVTQHLTDDTLKVEVNLSKNYNAATRQLNLNVALNYFFDVADAQKITVYITESGLVDAQEFPDTIDTFYVHNNVLRAAVTDPLGDDITEMTTAGNEVLRNYSYTLPTTWNADNCRAIVFVSRNTADVNTGKEVLQVSGIDVQ